MKRNEGFTLVELLVAMVVGSIVTLAATSVLLLGLRYNAISIGAAQRQNTTRIIMSLLEGVASEGQIKGVESNLQGWTVLGTDDFSILSYDGGKKVIYTSDSDSPLLEGVYASYIELNSDNLLTVYVETEDGTYTSSIYCRMNKPDPKEKNEEGTDTEEEVSGDIGQAIQGGTITGTVKDFIEILLSQRSLVNGVPNPGTIVYTNSEGKPTGTGPYYAQWYADAMWHPEDGLQTVAGWDSSTPWCACFISWALTESRISSGVTDHQWWYANVDEFMAYFQNRTNGSGWKTDQAATGDLVFFDWEGGNDPEHVGVVLMENGDFIYTIEGNSAGLVAMRMYSTDDPAIIGYGSLVWTKLAQPIDEDQMKQLIRIAVKEDHNDNQLGELQYDTDADRYANSDANDRACSQETSTGEWWNSTGLLDSYGVTYVKGSNFSEIVTAMRNDEDYKDCINSMAVTRYVIGIAKVDGVFHVVITFTGPDRNPG